MVAEPRWRPNRVGRLHRSVAEQAHCSHGTLLPRSSSTAPVSNHIHTDFLGAHRRNVQSAIEGQGA